MKETGTLRRDRQTDRQSDRRDADAVLGERGGAQGAREGAQPPLTQHRGAGNHHVQPRPTPNQSVPPKKRGSTQPRRWPGAALPSGQLFTSRNFGGVPAPVWLAPNLGAAFWASFSPVVAPAQTLIPPAGRGWAQRYLLVTALWYSMYVLPSNAMASASPAAFSMITGGGKTGRCHGTEHGQARKTSLYPHLPSPGTCQHRASPWRGFTGALGLVNWEQVPVFAAS